MRLTTVGRRRRIHSSERRDLFSGSSRLSAGSGSAAVIRAGGGETTITRSASLVVKASRAPRPPRPAPMQDEAAPH